MDELIPEPFRKTHREKQMKFLMNGGYKLEKAQVTIVNKGGYLMLVTATVQVHPSIEFGLTGQAFFFPRETDLQVALVMTNCRG